MNRNWASVMVLFGVGYCIVRWVVGGIEFCCAILMVRYQVSRAGSISFVLFPSRLRSGRFEFISGP